MNKKITSTRPVYTPKFNSTRTTTSRITSSVPARSNTQKNSSSSLDLEALKILVITLSASDQQELLDFLALNRINCSITSQQERKLNMFTDSLADELGSSIGQSSRIFPRALLGQAKKMWKDSEALLKDLKMEHSTLPETKAMYNVLSRVLVLHAHKVSAKAKIPVNMKLVLQTTTPLHALLDEHFPGYIMAGVMHLARDQMKNGFVEDKEDD